MITYYLDKKQICNKYYDRFNELQIYDVFNNKSLNIERYSLDDSLAINKSIASYGKFSTLTNFNIQVSIPLINSGSFLTNYTIISKRKNSELEAIILYNDKSSNELTNSTINLEAIKYFNFFNLKINKINSINLHTFMLRFLNNEYNLTDIGIYNSSKLGFIINFKFNIVVNNNCFIDSVRLKLPIINIKESLAKFADQLNEVVDYNQVVRNKFIDFINSTNYSKIINKSNVLTITDILSIKNFTKISNNKFIDYFNSIDTSTNEFKTFIQLCNDEVLLKNKDSRNIKILNIYGVRYTIRNNIDIRLSKHISKTNRLFMQKLGYSLLHYSNNYTKLLSLINIVKLKILSSV